MNCHRPARQAFGKSNALITPVPNQLETLTPRTHQLIRNQNHFVKGGMDPKFKVGPHETLSFGISTSSIDARFNKSRRCGSFCLPKWCTWPNDHNHFAATGLIWLSCRNCLSVVLRPVVKEMPNRTAAAAGRAPLEWSTIGLLWIRFGADEDLLLLCFLVLANYALFEGKMLKI
jgi:hypothetical protein